MRSVRWTAGTCTQEPQTCREKVSARWIYLMKKRRPKERSLKKQKERILSWATSSTLRCSKIISKRGRQTFESQLHQVMMSKVHQGNVQESQRHLILLAKIAKKRKKTQNLSLRKTWLKLVQILATYKISSTVFLKAAISVSTKNWK